MTDRSTWWEDVDAELLAAESSAPDPWGDQVPAATSLTADQEAFLLGLADQPAVPRLRGVGEEPTGAEDASEPGGPDRSTGSPPGDTATGDS
jgi:hypothetical protein